MHSYSSIDMTTAQKKLHFISSVKSWRQHPTKQQLYDHLPSIMKTIKIRRTRHAGLCCRSKDKLISDVLLWTPSHGRAKAGRPARTYIQQLCANTGCSPEDLPEAMDDREGRRERVRDIAQMMMMITLRCRAGCDSFPWMAPLYPCYVPYNAEC